MPSLGTAPLAQPNPHDLELGSTRPRGTSIRDRGSRLADLSGMPEAPLKALRYSRFVLIGISDLNHFVACCSRRLTFTIENRLSGEPDDLRLKVDLRFQCIDDIAPEGVALQVRPLKELLDLRNSLANLRASLAGWKRETQRVTE